MTRKTLPGRPAWILLAALALVQTAGAATTSVPAPERITLERYGFSFARLPDWHFIQNQPSGRRLFDLVRFFESSGSPVSNRRALYDVLAARAYMLADGTAEIGSSGVQYAQRIVNEIRMQGYELMGNRYTRENDIPLLAYVFRYKPPVDSTDREIWLSLRFFLTRKYIFSFYGSSRSKTELGQLDTLFSTIRFLTNADGTIRQP